MKLAVDASNIRAGGGVTHLRQVLLEKSRHLADDELHVWLVDEIAELIGPIPGIVLRRIPGSALGGWWRAIWQSIVLPLVLRRERFSSVIILGGVYFGWFRPFVVLAQNLLPFELEEARREALGRNYLRLRVLRVLQGITFKRADGVVFMSEFSRARIKSVIGSLRNDIVIHHGVSERFLLRGVQAKDYPSRKPFRWLYVSILEEYKHQESVCKGVALTRKLGFDVELTLVGPAAKGAEARLQRAIKDLGAESFISYLGQVPHQEMDAVYGSHDGIIFASSCETFGLIVLEALASGTPLLCSNRSALPEVAGNAAIYFDPEEPKSLSLAMRSILDSPQRWRGLRQLGLERARAFSWTTCCNRLFAYVSEVSGVESRRFRDRRVLSACGASFLHGRQRRDGFLDTALVPGVERIRPAKIVAIAPVQGQFFVPPRSIRLLWNYSRRIGLREVLKKVRSRMAEVHRNEKWITMGVGRIYSPVGSPGDRDEWVVFISPNWTQAFDFVTLPKFLFRPLRDVFPGLKVADCGVEYMQIADGKPFEKMYEVLAGWSHFSGKLPPASEVNGFLDLAEDYLAQGACLDGASEKLKSLPSTFDLRAPVDAIFQGRRRPNVRTAALFGLGNYAKTNIIPNLGCELQLRQVHEIDPLQLGPVWRGDGVSYSTSPFPQEADWFDVVFVAGYHHTHAAIAVEFLRRGSVVVCEKPIAVERAEYASVAAEIAKGGRFYACFHKRYSSWNAWIRADLQISASEPLNYHAIVYEVRLPERHWYRWPNSRSRLVSNGCHWIDHFLFLNNFAEVKRKSVEVSDDGTLLVSIGLVNGALFSLVLTDSGSYRVGVRELVEITAPEGRVRITDASKYVSERRDVLVREYEENPLKVYGEMYRRIINSALSERASDSLATLSSTYVTLELEEMLNGKSGDWAQVSPWV